MAQRLEALYRRIVASLRGRLLLFLLFPLLSASIVSVVLDYRNGLRTANDAYDHALASATAALATLITAQQSSGQAVDIPRAANTVLRSDPVDTVYYAVLDDTGALLAGDASLRHKANPANIPNPTLHDDTLNGVKVRIATYRTTGTIGKYTVMVAETRRKRGRSAIHTASLVLMSNLMVVGVTLITVFFAVKVSLSPLLELGRRIQQRAPDDLRPVADQRIPEEAQPLVASINQLMDNVRSAHDAQQAFISNAAHQMRTPIAALQTQLELAVKQYANSDASFPASALAPRVERLRSGVRRLAHLTNQMLSLARSSPEADIGHEFQRVDLAQLCENAASEFLDAALERHIDLGFETQPAVVSGSAWMLREMLANLIDNAIAYTPTGGHVTVRCRPFNRGSMLEVEDDGPGIPEELRERVFERFYRAKPSEAPEQDDFPAGTGLGLAIVRAGALRHHARIELDTPESGQGARFRIIFPAA